MVNESEMTLLSKENLVSGEILFASLVLQNKINFNATGTHRGTIVYN